MTDTDFDTTETAKMFTGTICDATRKYYSCRIFQGLLNIGGF